VRLIDRFAVVVLPDVEALFDLSSGTILESWPRKAQREVTASIHDQPIAFFRP